MKLINELSLWDFFLKNFIRCLNAVRLYEFNIG